MTLRVRKPTGRIAWPFILVEGQEKAGKSALAYRIARSEQIGRTFVADLGEGTADEYAELGPYEVLEHDGTFTDLFGQLREAAAVPAHEGRPNAIVLDDGTVLWDLLRDWVGARARQSKRARDVLRSDPDAPIDVPRHLWNDANDRWEQVVTLLRTFPGVGIMIARGKEVSGTGPDGQPTKGREWQVEVQRGTTGATSAWVRCMRPHTATLVGVRNLHLEVPPGGLDLPNDDLNANPLEHLIFDVMAGAGFVESQRIAPSLADMTTPAEGNGRVDPDEQARADGWESAAEAKAAWGALRDADMDPVARRRARMWREAKGLGMSKSDHAKVGAAAEWFASHRQREVETGAPFDTPGEEQLADQEALDAYDRHLAGNGDAGDPGRPFEPAGETTP